jgi:hypothetical protein
MEMSLLARYRLCPSPQVGALSREGLYHRPRGRTETHMISNRFKPFSNFRILQFLQSENPAPLPFRQEVLGGRYPQHRLCTQPTGAYCGISGSFNPLCAFPPSTSTAVDHRGSPSLHHIFGQLFLTPPTRGSSPSIALSSAGQLPPRVPRSGGVPGRTEGNNPELFHKCRGSDLNRRLLDFQSRSPRPLYKKSPGALSK